MRAGKSVTYVDAKGKEREVTIEAVTGSGVSGYKILALTYTPPKKAAVVVENVPHEKDDDGKGFWK